MRSLRAVVSILAAVAVFAAADRAHADHEGETTLVQIPDVLVGYQPSWFLMGGATGGASFTADGTGGYAGAELSLVRTERAFWSGLYVDGMWNFRSAAPTVSFGPEFGYTILGFDAGLGLRGGDSGMRPGFMGRLSLNAGIASLYGRYIYWPWVEQYTVQAGATFKLPLIAPWGAGSTRGSGPSWTDPSWSDPSE